ncbi:MAG TPA: long-chain fatty acid--CoA ligase [Solirubrobacterales bacterium]|nr:long-chain fatty acid--CoA ligase [Solirubrobacterales bacterium]
MKSTMSAMPLTTRLIYDHGRTVHHRSLVTTYAADGSSTTQAYAEIADRADRLAVGLQRIGIAPGDRVGTFCWNHGDHLAAYFAVPCMGAVLHTVNIRLFPEQVSFVVNHAADRLMIVDQQLVDLLAPIADSLPTVERFLVVGGDGAALGARAMPVEAALAEPGAVPEWPELDESDAASICYTSGTTGDPRGVAYGHRSTFVHSLAQCATNAFAIGQEDTILLSVPMFHSNAWGLPYSGWMSGADFVMPQSTLDPASLARMFEERRPTFTAGVPTLFNDLLNHESPAPVDLSSLRVAVCGGSAVTGTLIDAMKARGVPMLQGWGMTETSPLCALSHPPKHAKPEEDSYWRSKSGRPSSAGIELRIVDDEGAELPWDGASVGEVEVRGPWVATSYYGIDTPEKFHHGWLRTGDVGYGDQERFVQLTDRAKDVIKSGGEWISSLDLEDALASHPDVLEVAVIGVADERWEERPLACIVLRDGAQLDPAGLAGHIAPQVARWWIPERWAAVAEIPKTSVGKADKRALRERHAAGELEVIAPTRG